MAAIDDYIRSLADEFVSKVATPQDFTQLLGFQEYFNPNLARQAALSTAEQYFMPQIDEGVSNIRQQAAQRGLFRSGVRGRQETGLLEDIAEQEAILREELFSQREKEAGERYGVQQERFERAPSKSAYNIPAVAKTPSDQIEESLSYLAAQNYRPTSQARVVQGDYTPSSIGIGSMAGGASEFGEGYRNWYQRRYGRR